jgi:UDP-glucuronate 4-epimerase
MRVLVTGVAGFIGFHLARRLMARGDEVVGVDNLVPYYDPALKRARLDLLAGEANGDSRRFRFVQADISDRAAMPALFAQCAGAHVVNLAAQAGVRHSIEHPHDYVDANLVGFLNVLEGCRRHGAAHLVYASSSSVYGLNAKLPFAVDDNVDHPVSLYAATKKANELMAHTYSHLYGVPTTGLRFFTVYGPWGRPDMALFQFTRAILAGQPIPVYNRGEMRRDFTYVDDIVEGLVRVIDRVPGRNECWDAGRPEPGSSSAPYRVYNLGNGRPVALLDFVAALEAALGKQAIVDLQPMQPGDVPATAAEVGDLEREFSWRPTTPVTVGIPRFVAWYREWYRIPADGV